MKIPARILVELSYDPRQPRDSKGRWTNSPGGREVETGHDLWILSGVSYGATAAAARMTNAEGWDSGDYGPWEQELAKSMLDSIQAQPVRTTRYYSGHTSRPAHLKEGDTFDIPLMAISSSRHTASIYSDTLDLDPKRTAAARTAKVDKEVAKVLSTMSDVRPEIAEAVRGAFLDISARGYGIKRPEHYNPPTTYEFVSNKSVPIRPNERVASGRYKVESITREPLPGRVTYDPDTHRYADAYSERIRLSFVEDLKISE